MCDLYKTALDKLFYIVQIDPFILCLCFPAHNVEEMQLFKTWGATPSTEVVRDYFVNVMGQKLRKENTLILIQIIGRLIMKMRKLSIKELTDLKVPK